MKKIWILTTVALTALAQAALANVITTTSTGFNGGLNGGEFWSVTDNNGSFLTFCVELNEHFYLGHQYSYKLSDAAIRGGTATSDPLSQGSAWLYLQFRSGALDPAYSANHNVNAGQLQQAIWALEDEVTYAAAGGAGNTYIAMVESEFGTFADAQLDYAGNQVRVINVYDPNNSDGLGGVYDANLGGYLRQDLIGVVPDGGLTAMLLGMGMLSLAWVRRMVK